MAYRFSFNSSLDSCTGVEIKMQPDGTVEARFVNLSLDKKLITINWKKAKESALEKVVADISGPVAITITGRGVLVRKTKRINELTNGALQGLFPGLKFSEFYVQNFVSGDCSFVTLIRRETLSLVLKAFGTNRQNIHMISIGVFVVDHVIPQLNIYNEFLAFDGHSINLDEDKTWKGYNQIVFNDSGFVLKIDIEPIEEQFLLAYATAFQLILNHSLEPVQILVDEIQSNKIEFSAKLLFEKRVTITALILFGTLLLNFLLFTYCDSENKNNEGMVGRQTELSLNRKKVDSEINEKEKLVEKLAWNNGLTYGFICDQIGLIAPNSITLTELSINFYSGKEVLEQVPGIRRLKVSGRAENVYVVNQFIYACKNRSWVKQVELQKFVADEQEKTQSFTIVIKY
jgi:hypothetical protein